MKAVIGFLALITLSFNLSAQQKTNTKNNAQRMLINKLEFVVGPNLCFNHGNMLVDNYNQNNVTNDRLTKVGYSIGVGVYHSVNDHLDIVARVLWEQKGSKSELSHPLPPATQFINSEYTYDYLTISLAPKFLIGQNKRFGISIGGYYSILQNEMGRGSVYDTKNSVPPSNGSFKGRYWHSFKSDGSTASVTFIPGMESFEKYDYGLSVGLAYTIPIKGPHSVSLQLLDNYGLKNIYNKKYPENQLEKNHNLCLLIGYLFNRS